MKKLDLIASTWLCRWEKLLITALCLIAAGRVFAFSAAFPFFNNIDENAHVDLILKYTRLHWPDKPVEHFDPLTSRLFILYGTGEYMSTPERMPGGKFPQPLWKTPEIKDAILQRDLPYWTGLENHEANSPPFFYAVAAVWYVVGRELGLSEGQQLYWLRFLNIPIVVLFVLTAYCFCREFYPSETALRFGVPLLAALLPLDVFYSVNPDVGSPVLFTVSLMLLLIWYSDQRQRAGLIAVIGLLTAATFLVTYTNIALPILFGVIVLLKARGLYSKGNTRAAFSVCGVAMLAAALPVGIVFVRNYALLGDWIGTAAKIKAVGYSPRPLAALLKHPIFTVGGFWAFWEGIMKTLWRGELVWHLQPIASPIADHFFTISSTIFLIAAAFGLWREKHSPVDMAGGAALLLSVLCLAVLSISFDYGRAAAPSESYPYFTSGRMIAGALVPFMVFYVKGITFLLKSFSRVAVPLAFMVVVCLLVTASEVVLSKPAFESPYNWFHLYTLHK